MKSYLSAILSSVSAIINMILLYFNVIIVDNYDLFVHKNVGNYSLHIFYFCLY